VRFTLFAGKAACLLTAGAATAILALTGGATAAQAVTAAPKSAPVFNGGVYAIAYRGSTVYVGGSFTSATSGGRTYSRQRLAAFDSRTGALLNWAPSADRTVRALAVSGSSVYAAGDFGHVSDWRRDALVQLDAVSGAVGTFAHAVSGAPYSLAVGNGRLYLAGSFTAVDHVARGNLAAFSLTGGGLDGGWRPRADDAVHAVSAYGSQVYLGGMFEAVNGVAGTSRLASVSGTTGAVDWLFRPRTEAEVNAVTVDTAGVYVATGGQGGRAIAYTSRGAVRWQRVFDGDAAAITTLNGVTYVGGHFDHACLTASNGAHGTCTDGSVARVKLAALTSTGALSTWAPAANGVVGVRVLAVDRTRGTLSAGGDFTLINGQDRRRFATFG
jgi:hypothetical protein